MRTTISSKGQIVLPADLRDRDRISAGQQFDIERLQSGEYLLKRVSEPTIDMMDWLLACPEKDWFQTIPSESTDTL
jgi:AbrB family looped-hinge helix DNA binding protein